MAYLFLYFPIREAMTVLKGGGFNGATGGTRCSFVSNRSAGVADVLGAARPWLSLLYALLLFISVKDGIHGGTAPPSRNFHERRKKLGSPTTATLNDTR